jgi:hypothetical protein
MSISRVQGNKRGIASNSSLSITLDSTPTSGNLLIAVIGTYGSYPPSVSSITQSNVSWSRQVYSSTSSLYGRNVEIWAGVIQSSASASLTITLASTGSGASSDPVIADICEYSGLLTSSFLDKTSSAQGAYTTTLSTGTISTTGQASELWIGGIFNVCDAGNGNSDSSPTPGYTMLDGAGSIYAQTKSLAYIEKIVSSIGTASCNVIGGSYTTYEAYVGCIATFKAAAMNTGPTTQYSFLHFKKGNGTYAACVVPSGSGQSGMGGVPKIRQNGVTYDIYLVQTTDQYASPLRIQTSLGTKAVRYYTTHADTQHSDTAAHNDHTDVAGYNDYVDTLHSDTAHSDAPFSNTGGHSDVAHNDHAHSDAAFANTAHTDAPFTNAAHSDASHADVSFSNTPHSDFTNGIHTDYTDYNGVGSGKGAGFINYTDTYNSSHLDTSVVQISQYQNHTNTPYNYWHADFSDAGGTATLQYGDTALSHTDTNVFPIAYQDHNDNTHGNTSFSNVPHSDIAHSDAAHNDQAHSDIAHNDQAHSDSAFANTAHSDSSAHTDHTHSDVAHNDQAHSDSFTNSTHSDNPFTNTAHSDAGHSDGITIPTF